MAPGLGGWVLCSWSKPIKGCDEWLLLCTAGSGTLTEWSASAGMSTAGEGEPGLGKAWEPGLHLGRPAPSTYVCNRGRLLKKNFIGDV